METTYHRLGDYIRPVDVRNRDLTVTELFGLTIDKTFIPSVANIIGTDLSNYKVIHKEQFACSLMQVSRDNKIPVAMFEGKEGIMSPAYPLFEVVDTTALLPQYLMMWFSRKEFDREASFFAVGGVRGSLTWEDFCDMRLPIPSIDRQREIVAEYETLTRRIRLNEQMIEKLEAAAQALYRKMFIDNIDKQHLPQGWRIGTLGDFGDVVTGKTPSTIDENNFGNFMPFVTIPDMHEGCFVITTERMLSKKGVKSQSNKTIPKNSICVSCIGTSGLVIITTQDCQTNQQINTIILDNPNALYYLYWVCRDLENIISEYGIGGAVLNNLNKKEFENLPALLPPYDILEKSYKKMKPIFDAVLLYQQQKNKLIELQSLLLAKMGKDKDIFEK